MSVPAVVVVAHDKPRHLHRLVRALHPLPIFLHVDANTPEPVFGQMTAGLPPRVTLLDRIPAGWARREILHAELAGYRAALRQTDAEHIIVTTGADYPLVPTEELVAMLQQNPGRTFAEIEPLPFADWGVFGGYDRFLLLRQWPWRRRRMAVPLPRPLPAGIRAAGGSQTKIICRRDAEYVLGVWDSRPRLARFLDRCWIPDETAVPTLLHSRPQLDDDPTPRPPTAPHPWHIDWGGGHVPNPRQLVMSDFDSLAAGANSRTRPVWFARKFGEDSGPLLDRIDRELRGASHQSGDRAGDLAR